MYSPNATIFIFQLAILVMSVVIHEFSHGAVAYALGDKTAKYQGRLTLNPIPHIDPVGSILLPIIFTMLGGPAFGWAKPVPYNPYNLRNQQWGPALVGAAGPLSNLIIAIVFGLAARATRGDYLGFIPTQSLEAFTQIALVIIIINIALAILNLMPIPPLDGSKILFAIFPGQGFRLQIFFQTWGLLLIIPVIILLSPVIGFLTNFIFRIIVGI